MRPKPQEHPAFARDVRDILDAGRVGLRWPDNVGPEVSVRWSGAATSVAVQVPGEPAYLAVTARNESTGEHECNPRIVWTYTRGVLRVSSLDVSAPSDPYEVRIGIMVR
jgi:hypothetical protein